MSLKRELRSHPGYRISKDGYVFRGQSHSPEPIEARDGVYTKRLTVLIEHQFHRIDALLSQTFYDGHLILPRDGNLMHLATNNVIVVKKLPAFDDPHRKLNVDRVQWIWHLYEYQKIRIGFLAEKSGLPHYSDDDFIAIIKTILFSGIRT